MEHAGRPGTNTLNMARLSPGLYLMRVTNAGSTMSRPFVKR